MGSFSIWHWLIVLVIVLLLFGGAGKIPKLMGDMAKGVKAFKQGLKDEPEATESAPQPTPQPARTLGEEVRPADRHDTAPKH